MTITLELPLEVETKIKIQASNDGLKVEDYVKSLIEQATNKRELTEKMAEKSFDEILKPFRDEVEASEMSDDELDGLFRQARREASNARHSK